MRRIRLVSILLAVFLAAGVYRAYMRDPSQQPSEPRLGLTPAKTMFETQASASLPTHTPEAEVSDFAEKLLAMPEPVRNQVFWLTLRDARFECEEVKSARPLGASAWLARCGEPWAYELIVDEFGRLSASPVPYGDFLIGVPRMQDVPLKELR
jgi:hypothetical protein